jgi:hypothetical protein
MQTVCLSKDDYEAARQIVAWLAYPHDANQRLRAEQTLFAYLQRLAGQIPRYENGKAIERNTTASRMMSIDQRFIEAIYAGQISSLSIVKNGVEVAPWPVNWGGVAMKLNTYNVGEDARKQIYKRYWRRYHQILHLASSMDGHFASIHETVNKNRLLDAFLLDGSWVDKVLADAADIKKYNNPKMRRFDQGPVLLDFFR